jgi:hypothetical protein
MVNTVGSRRNKHWTKKWSNLKRDMYLTKIQRSLIIGSMLGDGTMRIGKGSINANFKIEHGLKQRKLVLWKYKILESLVFTRPKVSYRYRDTGERYQKSWWFRTIRHPLLTDIYKDFYVGEKYRVGRKIVPKDIKKDLDALALAVWIMDDGSFNQKIIDVSTYSFTEREIQILQEALAGKYDISSNYYKDRNKGFRIYFNQSETRKLVQIIRPHFIPSMEYKIGVSIDPVTTGSKHPIRD